MLRAITILVTVPYLYNCIFASLYFLGPPDTKKQTHDFFISHQILQNVQLKYKRRCLLETGNCLFI